MKELNELQRLGMEVKNAIPKDRPDHVQWLEANAKLPGSARSKTFKLSLTPWIAEPLSRCFDFTTRRVTVVKPVQSGGSVLGEVAIIYWIRFFRGFLQYNWSNDKRANERWDSRIENILLQSLPDKFKGLSYQKGEVDFGGLFFRMQGVFEPHNLDSDSIQLQVNEEVHDWQPGHLEKARNRHTAVWNYKSLDVSNAGFRGDQLDKAFTDGTAQFWEVKCPGCSNPHHDANSVFHRMRTRWEDDKPQLGGLRYDADDARVGYFDYNYNIIRPTIRYQFPCGCTVANEDLTARRSLSSTGRYSEPTNPNAELKYRSYTYQAVVVDYIDWMELIKQKHAALKARSLGDPEPWRIYTQERECLPYDPENIPIVNVVEVSKGLKKGHAGLPPPRFRTFGADRQQGDRKKGETPYWWLVIRDFKIAWGSLRSVLVYEGRLETDEEVISILDEYGCVRHHGCADSGDDTDHVYAFCYKYGINAIKGGAATWYPHEGGAKRSYGSETALCEMMGYPPKHARVESHVVGDHIEYSWDDREPMFWLYSKGAIAERMHYFESHHQFDIPEDVSQSYKEHADAEERIETSHPRTGQPKIEWIQRKRRNDLKICERYCCMMWDMTLAMGDAQDVSDITTTNISK